MRASDARGVDNREKFRLCLGDGHNVDELATLATFGEHNDAVDEGIDCVVLAEAYVQTRVMHGAALTFDDVAGFACLTTKNLDTESLAF